MLDRYAERVDPVSGEVPGCDFSADQCLSGTVASTLLIFRGFINKLELPSDHFGSIDIKDKLILGVARNL